MINTKTEVVEVSDYIRNKAENFANERCREDQSLYQKRGAFKREDILVGAMAELAVYKYLRSKGFEVSKPDLSIHKKKDKSFDADLSDGVKMFHVKGQSKTSAKRYGNSWLMQRYDKLVKAPILNNYLVPTAVCLETNTVTIFGMPSFTALHTYSMFGECSVPSFRNSKVALYLDTLSSLTKKCMWGVVIKKTANDNKKERKYD